MSTNSICFPNQIAAHLLTILKATLLLAFAFRPVSAEPVLVFAASSMAGALDAVVSDYKRHASENVRISFAASSTLARQLTSGAPADIYISANKTWISYAEDRLAIQPASKFVLVRNRLVLAVPVQSINTLDNLSLSYLQGKLRVGRMAIGNPAHVPAGIYAQEAFEKLGFWKIMKHKLAPVINVRAALALLERQEVPLAVLYKTDALASHKVKKVYTFPNSSHSPIEYTAALTAKRSNKAASRFYKYLKSSNATSRLIKFGFDPA